LNTTRVLLVALLMHGLFASPLFAADSRQTYVVGVENLDYQPFYSNSENGYQGFARNTLDLFQRDAGIKLIYRALPVDALKEAFYRGELDFKFPDDPLWQPEQFQTLKVYYSEPVTSYVDGVSVLRKNLGAAVRVVGSPRGFSNSVLGDFAQKNGISLVEKDSIQDLLAALVSGEIDGVWGSMDVFRYRARSMSNIGLHLDLTMPHQIGHYPLSTLKHQVLLARFNEFLRRHDVRIQEIETRFRIDALRDLRVRQLRRESNEGSQQRDPGTPLAVGNRY